MRILIPTHKTEIDGCVSAGASYAPGGESVMVESLHVPASDFNIREYGKRVARELPEGVSSFKVLYGNANVGFSETDRELFEDGIESVFEDDPSRSPQLTFHIRKQQVPENPPVYTMTMIDNEGSVSFTQVAKYLNDCRSLVSRFELDLPRNTDTFALEFGTDNISPEEKDIIEDSVYALLERRI